MRQPGWFTRRTAEHGRSSAASRACGCSNQRRALCTWSSRAGARNGCGDELQPVQLLRLPQKNHHHRKLIIIIHPAPLITRNFSFVVTQNGLDFLVQMLKVLLLIIKTNNSNVIHHHRRHSNQTQILVKELHKSFTNHLKN